MTRNIATLQLTIVAVTLLPYTLRRAQVHQLVILTARRARSHRTY